MTANIADKITNVSSGTRPVSTTVSTLRTTGATSLVCNDLTGWAIDTAVHFITYKIDGQGKVITGSQTDWKGIVSTNTINNLTVTGGTDAGNAVGDIVEILPTARWAKELTDAIRVHSAQDGNLLPIAVSNVVPTNAIQNNAVTTAKVADTAITAAKIDLSTLPTAKFKVSRAAAANTGNGAFLAVSFDTEDYDIGNNFASGVFTVPVTGKYHFNWIINSNLSTGVAETLIASLFVNGTEKTTGTRYTGMTVGGSCGSTDELLTAGDVVSIRVFCSTTRPLITGKEVTFSGTQML